MLSELEVGIRKFKPDAELRVTRECAALVSPWRAYLSLP